MLSLLFGAIMLGLGFSSCTQVSVKEPFGTKPARLDPDVWNGVWRMDGGDPGRITVSKDRPGEFAFGEVSDSKAEAKEESEELTVAVREVDGDLFFTVIDDGTPKEDHKVEEGFVWGRIAVNDNTALVWLPDSEAFEALLKDGTIPGKDTRKKDAKTGMTSGGISLDKLEEKHLELIAKGTRGVLFAWDKPMVFVRVPWREEAADAKE